MDESKSLASIRRSELRSLLKKCFKNPMFSLVPFEIWRDLIVQNSELKTVATLSFTCIAFKEIVDDIGENNFNLALYFRRVCQIPRARKYLLKCAENNNSKAMFHLGYAYFNSGWGLEKNEEEATQWFRKSAEHGDSHGMAFYSFCLKFGQGIEADEALSNQWGEKALLSKNAFASCYCHRFGLGTQASKWKELAFLSASAKEGDEFGQYYMGCCYYSGKVFPTIFRQNWVCAISWYLKAAEQGLCDASSIVGSMYKDGKGCCKGKESDELGVIWSKKAKAQLFKERKVE